MAHRSDSLDTLSPLQRAYVRIVELEARLEEAERRAREPIAIVGMACRFPGAAGLRAYWQLLAEGRNAVTEIPRERWDVDAYYSADPAEPGKMYTRWGGFLDGVDLFDPQFFSITPREAVSMDPQQRLLLEVTWEALEHACIAADALHGSRSGVFMGTGFTDYARLLARLDLGQVTAYSGSGIQPCFCAGRISYTLGLHGPSMPVDTACSSSLVALHQACRSLRAAECDLALAGGVNLLLAPEANIFLSKAGALSPDGLCKTFDAAANGFVRGEGCGVLVLKRLSDARANGDNVHAVIVGSAVNHDGRSSGLTVPNGPAQEAVIRQALASARLQPGAVGYVEAHGTGTPLGDPIEIQALAGVYGAEARRRPLIVGSVKTNFGHLEAAAGVAAVIKVVLMMQHRQVAQHLHFRTLNPHIGIDPSRITIPRERLPWPSEPDAPRTAGVSSFGLSGTNAHVLLQESAEPPAVADSAVRGPVTLVISAKRPDALRALVVEYREFLSTPQSDRGDSLVNVAFTAATGRSHHDHRLAVVADSTTDAVGGLEGFLAGAAGRRAFAGRRPIAGTPKLAFVFSGQGSQRARMACDLMECEPVFRQAIEACDTRFRDLGDRSIVELVTSADAVALAETRFAQPAVFAVQVALAALWRSCGIEPDAVVGHSVGEIAAAHVAGVLDLDAAVRLVHHRAALMQRLTGKGRMAAVALTPEAAAAFLSELDPGLSIAAVNAPRSVVLSGDPVALDAALARLRERNVASRDLGVNYAFHSTQTIALEAELVAALRDLRPDAPSVPIVSTVSGRMEQGATFDARYWAANMTRPVLFSTAIDRLVSDGVRTFVEVGPQPVLRGAVAQCVRARSVEAHVLASAQADEPESTTFSRSLAQLYVAGYPVKWNTRFTVPAKKVSTLPTYPWQRQRCWVETPQDVPAPAPAPPRTSTDLEDAFYQLRWVPRSLGAVADAGSGRWLVLADQQVGLARSVADALEQRGHRVRTITVADVLAGESSHEALDRGRVIDVVRQALDEPDSAPWRGIVHLWAIDTAPTDATTGSSLIEDQTWSVGTALQAIQALASRSGRESPRLWLVTQGAQAPLPDGETIAVGQAPVWGFGRTCAAEYPAVWGGLIDLDPSSSTIERAGQIVEGLFSATLEDQVAFRGGRAYVARVMHADPPAERPFRLRPDAAYLVTGGRSGIGFEVARWLADEGARTLVLMARTEVPPRSGWAALRPSDPNAALIAMVGDLEARGVTVHLPAVDVSNELQLAAFFDDYERQGHPPIRGVFHAASVWKNRKGRSLVAPISQMDVASLTQVLAPKVVGSWLLCQRLGSALDFFVLFSTGASIVGSAGQATYAAANAFLDALAAELTRRKGPRTLAVNWGPIAGAGFALTPEGRSLFALWERRGIGAISVGEVLGSLRRLIPDVAAQRGIMRTDWARLTRTYAELLRAPWASELVVAQPDAVSVDVVRTLTQASASERRDILISRLQQEVTAIMGLRAEDAPEPEQGLFALGMDSLLSLELRNQLQFMFRRDIPAAAVFDHPSIAALAGYLLREVLGLETSATATPVARDAGDLLDEIERLPEAEVTARLAARVVEGVDRHE